MGVTTAMGGNILKDAFGTVAMVAMTPLITIQILGLIFALKSRKDERVAKQDIPEEKPPEDEEIIEL